MSQTERIRQVCRYIETHSEEALALSDLAAKAEMSQYHFARRFKAVVGVTPKQYLADIRLKHFKVALHAKKGIDAAVYDAGYGSPSRVYENAATRLGMTPAQYRRAGAGVAISYAALDTPAGLMMIGATDRGICFVQFGDSEEALLQALQGEYRNAEIAPMPAGDDGDFRRWVEAIGRHLWTFAPRSFRCASGDICCRFPTGRCSRMARSPPRSAIPKQRAPSHMPARATRWQSSSRAIA